MVLLKMARISTGTVKEDNYVDLIGYAAPGAEMATAESLHTIETTYFGKAPHEGIEDFRHADPRNLLSRAQFEQVLLAIRYNIPIIIDGDRTKPTGKTTLCDYLMSQGAVAHEAWELEEMGQKPGNKGPENSVHLVIQLNRLLSIFQNKENAD